VRVSFFTVILLFTAQANRVLPASFRCAILQQT
jgi:hypothetical protein